MPKCKSCGAEMQDTQKFCNRCGYPQYGDVPNLTWTGRVTFVKNPQVLRAYLIFFVLIVIMGVLLSLVTGTIVLLYLLIIIAIVFIFLFILASIIMEYVTSGGLEIQGIISPEGVAHQVGKTTRTINQGVLLFGILAVLGGSRSGMTQLGGGLIAFSNESNAIPWDKIRSVKVYSRNKLIVLRDAILISPVALYCTDDNFEQVLEVVRKNIPKEATFSWSALLDKKHQE